LRLSEYYGSAFTFGPEPSTTWVFHLQDLTADQIGHGIRNLPRHESSFPPNPGQFRDLCLCDFDWEHKRIKLIDTSHLIEDTTAKAKQRAEGLQAILALREQVKL